MEKIVRKKIGILESSENEIQLTKNTKYCPYVVKCLALASDKLIILFTNIYALAFEQLQNLRGRDFYKDFNYRQTPPTIIQTILSYDKPCQKSLLFTISPASYLLAYLCQITGLLGWGATQLKLFFCSSTFRKRQLLVKINTKRGQKMIV